MRTVFLVADPPLRDRLRAALEASPEITVVGQVDHVREALAFLQRPLPGLLLLADPAVERESGLIPAVAELGLPILLLAAAPDWGVVRRAAALGARDILPLETDPETWRAAVLEHARPLGQDNPDRGTVWAFFSPRGGSGRTTLAVNLAVALSLLKGHTAILVDLDPDDGGAADLIGQRPRLTLADLAAAGPLSFPGLLPAVIPVPHSTAGILRAYPLAGGGSLSPDHLRQTVETLRAHYPVVLLDAPQNYGDVTLAALDLAERVFLVTQPDMASLRSAKRALTLFREGLNYPAGKVVLVLNRADAAGGLALPVVEQALGAPVSAALPSGGPWPTRAMNHGVPLLWEAPASPLARAIQSWARRLVATRAPGPRPGRRSHRAARPRPAVLPDGGPR
ncbi:conserved protein of unknown function [Candidatus Hydrogenisulfobacillus filiaventi]|uniref:Stage 0 sporulation protein A homolog n=1 Tax=Candidatus Hydrogenisulfobacillus filiaventi TaxID=2707344 RepID=A0A6F8ZE18_9FIRM|nr:conserved protein of unknown function [Candidatus Hydrogenisulfobacillus filiaventi]